MESEPIEEQVPEQNSERPHSRHAKASFVWSLVWLCCLVGMASCGISFHPGKTTVGGMIFPLFLLGAIAAFVAAMIYGIASLFQKNFKNTFGIIGVSIVLTTFTALVILMFWMLSHWAP